MTLTHSSTPAKTSPRRANALPSACMLDEYRIESILGAGGFGVTYKALDTHLETWVAIKEYFPVEWSFRDPNGVTVYPNTQGAASEVEGQLSDYLWGLERFLDEARVLARVQHPYVVRVKRYFRAHGTAYIVMDYEEGEPLNAVLRGGETLDEEEIRGLLEDVLPALHAVHEQGYLHRDIKPANLYVRSKDHRVMLIDFGAAREAVGRCSKSVTSLVTPGYSPPEQYTTRTDRYGPWTDIYALGAVLYRCVTGRTPAEAAERLLDDNLEPATQAGSGRYRADLLTVIDRALAVRPEQRFPTVADMQDALVIPPDENSHRTIVMPSIKPVRLLTNPPEMPMKPTAEAAQPLGKGATPHLARALPVKEPLNRTGMRWQLPAALAGGVALMATAAVIISLGSFEPHPESPPQAEVKAPPRYSMNASGGLVANVPVSPDPPSSTPALPPTVVEPEAPATPPATPLPEAGTAESTPVDTPAVEGAEQPPVAQQNQIPEAAGESPPTVNTNSVVPLPLGAVPSAMSQPAKPKTSVIDPMPETTKKSAVTTSVTDQKPVARDAKPLPKRPARRRIARKMRQESPVVVTPAEPVRVQPAPAPRRYNLWDAPMDTGFNQK